MATVNSATSGTTDSLLATLNARSSTSGAGTSATAEMEDRFLTLLVTQIKNQDPLNPLDNAQVTSQLAQINTVNGIEKLNSTLAKLLSAYDDSKSMQAASMIGKNVLVPGDDMAAAANGTMAGGVLLASDADKVTISILDSTGKLVQTEELGARKAGSFAFVWDGKNSSGAAAPAGSYTFKINATAGNDKVTSTALQFGTVSALVRGTDGFKLDLGDAGLVGLDDVQQIF